MNTKTINIIGVAASTVGLAASLVSNWVGEKQLDTKIAEKVAEELKKQGKES